VKTTRYFEEQVLRKRPYIKVEWIEAVMTAPLTRIVQEDGRIRLWASVVDDTGKTYILRVVTLEDGETVHNAFFDRNYREAE
jgi:hypothetical protein